MRRIVQLAPAVLLMAASASAQFTYTGFSAAQWGVPDATLGVDGAAIEDFEDTTLIPGLKIGVTSPNGSRAPSNTLPNLFNSSLDGFGNAFTTGIWDGQYGLVSTRDNASHLYTDAGNWGIVTFVLEGGADLFGFSLQNMELSASVRINGQTVGSVNSLFGLSSASGRNGYCVIRATGDAVINEVVISNNGSGDGYLMDHVAVRTVPAPGAAALLGLGALAAGRRRR